jgi:hypothetical protein
VVAFEIQERVEGAIGYAGERFVGSKRHIQPLTGEAMTRINQLEILSYVIATAYCVYLLLTLNIFKKKK